MNYSNLKPAAHLFRHADVAKEREVEGDLFLQDAGQGMAFRPGTFDGAIRYLKQCNYQGIWNFPYFTIYGLK
jgi:hypothetical protein